MSTTAVLVATGKVRPGLQTDFAAWKGRHDRCLRKFQGLVGSDLIPPTQPGDNEWTILLNFRTHDDLVAWQNSTERAEILAGAEEIFEGLRSRVEATFSNSCPGEMMQTILPHLQKAPSPKTVFLFTIFCGPNVRARYKNMAHSMSGKVYGGPWTMCWDEKDDKVNSDWHHELITMLRPFNVGYYIGESNTIERPATAVEAYSPICVPSMILTACSSDTSMDLPANNQETMSLPDGFENHTHPQMLLT